jgi:hypothetical protein
MLFHGPASGAGKFGELPQSLQRLIIQVFFSYKIMWMRIIKFSKIEIGDKTPI